MGLRRVPHGGWEPVSTVTLSSTLRFFNLEHAEYVAQVYLEDPEVLRADVEEVSGSWQVLVTRR